MTVQTSKDRRILDAMLAVLVVGMSCLFLQMGGHKIIVLNLFYLPIVLSGYYLGRLNAGVLALFSVLAVTIITTLDAAGFAAYSTPTMVFLALTVWGATLGLTAILVGTLCDERARKLEELHEAYVGIVEVLSKYLQSSDETATGPSSHVAELSQRVSARMKLSQEEIDDIRVAVLLCDLGNVEITTRLVSKAVSALEANPKAVGKHTFLGMELVHSLSSVIHGVLPLLVNQDHAARDGLMVEDDFKTVGMPLGAEIIRAVRAYDVFVGGQFAIPGVSPREAIEELRKDTDNHYDPNVLSALEQVVIPPAPATKQHTSPA